MARWKSRTYSDGVLVVYGMSLQAGLWGEELINEEYRCMFDAILQSGQVVQAVPVTLPAELDTSKARGRWRPLTDCVGRHQ